MKHIKEILNEIPAVGMLGRDQNCRVGRITVNPKKCKAEKFACHPVFFFGRFEMCEKCGRVF